LQLKNVVRKESLLEQNGCRRILTSAGLAYLQIGKISLLILSYQFDKIFGIPDFFQ